MVRTELRTGRAFNTCATYKKRSPNPAENPPAMPTARWNTPAIPARRLGDAGGNPAGQPWRTPGPGVLIPACGRFIIPTALPASTIRQDSKRAWTPSAGRASVAKAEPVPKQSQTPAAGEDQAAGAIPDEQDGRRRASTPEGHGRRVLVPEPGLHRIARSADETLVEGQAFTSFR